MLRVRDDSSGNGFFKGISSSSRGEYNILLLGETGAGKSTTINAFANYMKYAKFSDAIKKDFIELISSKFVLTDPETYETVTIESGKDENESGITGKSMTKEPRTYKFNYGSSTIRLIDTPGIGDTGGIDQDRENIDQILGMLHCFKDLHGIIILLKSSETRQTAFFQYCFAELLTQLHKSACDNIVICFTFSRNSFFTPGDGYQILKNFLKSELKEVKLNLTPNVNCFFIDNESYRFLVAKKFGISFPKNQTNSYQESWDISVQQTQKMFEYIIRNKPHDLENTTSLNSARKLIYQLAEPMVRLQSAIQDNISAIKDKEFQLNNSTQSKMELAKHLHTTVDDLVQDPLPYPTTVCGTCIRVVQFNNENKTEYYQRCHERCEVRGVARNTVGNPQLTHCIAMDSGGYCKHCRCHWQKHLHVTCTYRKVPKTIINTNKQREIQNEDDAIFNINSALYDMRSRVSEMTSEIKVIEDIGSKFAYILLEHSNTPYNKFIEPYLDLLINEEKKKMASVKDYPPTKLQSLEEMKVAHTLRVNMLEKAIADKSQTPISLKDIFDYKDQLLKLKHTGPQLKDMLKKSAFMNQKNFNLIEKVGIDVY